MTSLARFKVRPHSWLAFGGALCGLASAAPASQEIPVNVRHLVDSAIARMKPALVRIHVVATEYYEGREVKNQAVGSGAIITKDGYLITNHHVAGHGARMFCTLWNREEIEAELVGTDPLSDISILKLKPSKPRQFLFARFGDSSKLRVGDSVLAMGSPMAISQSVTLGIISNTEMVMPRFFGPMGRFRLDGEDVGTLVRWIAHDAAIYGGNSGGPLVNLAGEIVGINEIRLGLSGAIPGNLARSVAEQIMARGSVQRSWLGLTVQPLFKHEQERHGALIASILPDSPADRAGLQPGDLLVRLDDVRVDVHYDEQVPEFMRLVAGLPIGKEVSATIVRTNHEIAVRLTPGEREQALPKQQELKLWGLTARNFSLLLAKELKRPNHDGVLVTSVRPGGPAGGAKPALEPEDVILAVNEQPIKNLQDLIELTDKLTAGKSEPVPAVTTFERKAERHLTVIKVGTQELKDPGLEVSKAWLSVETQVISRDIARSLGRPDLKGFYVTQVFPKSAAEKAGLKSGDFITAVDDEKLTASAPEHDEEFAALIRQYEIGATVTLTVLRDGKESKIPVQLVRAPKLKREMKKYRDENFEFSARDISFFDVAEEQWPLDQKGALVEEVKSGSWAEVGALYTGDLILQVDGRPIQDVDALKTAMEQLAAKKRNYVVMQVLRGIHTAYLELEPAWKK